MSNIAVQWSSEETYRLYLQECKKKGGLDSPNIHRRLIAGNTSKSNAEITEITYTDQVGSGRFIIKTPSSLNLDFTWVRKQMDCEEEFLSCYGHISNIVKMIASHRNEKNDVEIIVLEAMDGNLNEYLIKHPILLPRHRLEMALQISDALLNMHRNYLIHRDIKPHNILYRNRNDQAPEIKLCDFGVTEETYDGLVTVTAKAWSEKYSSPEQFESYNLTLGTDIYALGVTLVELFGGLYESSKYYQLPVEFSDFSPLIKKCLCIDPESRPNIHVVHEFIKEAFKVDRVALANRKTSCCVIL